MTVSFLQHVADLFVQRWACQGRDDPANSLTMDMAVRSEAGTRDEGLLAIPGARPLALLLWASWGHWVSVCLHSVPIYQGTSFPGAPLQPEAPELWRTARELLQQSTSKNVPGGEVLLKVPCPSFTALQRASRNIPLLSATFSPMASDPLTSVSLPV